MRKSKTIVARDANGQPVTLTFQRLTIGQEKEYKEKVQDLVIADGRRMLASFSTHIQMQSYAALVKDLGGGACSLTGSIGVQQCLQGEGMRLFLKIAASEKHPDITDEALFELVNEQYEECLEVVKFLSPAAAAAARAEAKSGAGSDPK